MKLTTCIRFRTHFTNITYSRSKLSWCILKTLHGSIHGTAYFARAVSYTCKMFMKLNTGVIFHKHLARITYSSSKLSWCILKMEHGSIHGTTYFARAVSYTCKIFIKLIPGRIVTIGRHFVQPNCLQHS
jgi:hypothetical protein